MDILLDAHDKTDKECDTYVRHPGVQAKVWKRGFERKLAQNIKRDSK